MNRWTRAFCSFVPAFLAGLCLALTINQLDYFGFYSAEAQVALSADCDAGEDNCSPQTKIEIKPKYRDDKVKNSSQIRIFCWIMVPYMMPLMHMTIINESWGPRCDGFAFVASRIAIGTLNFPIIDVNATIFEAHQFPSIEWKRIWLSAWQLHANGALQKYDYFLLVRTGNYVIIENLRHMLRNRDPNKLFMLGRRMLRRRVGDHTGIRDSSGSDYLTADAGIVLSNGAFATMVTRGFSGTSSNPATRRDCGSYSVTKSYDTQLSACLKSLGIKTTDSRDSQGRERFHPVHPGSLLEDSRMPAWLRTDSYYRPVRACLSCPSPESVTFFGITEFHKTDAMIYHLGPPLLPYKK